MKAQIPEIIKRMKPEKKDKIKPISNAFRILIFEKVELICKEMTENNNIVVGEGEISCSESTAVGSDDGTN